MFGRRSGWSTGFGQRDCAHNAYLRGSRKGSQEPQEGHRARSECGQCGPSSEADECREGESWWVPRRVRQGGVGQMFRSTTMSGLGEREEVEGEEVNLVE